jgi:hypothetical protein
MKMSMPSRPATASIAAEPVSPLVAPTIVRRLVEGERRAVEEFEQPLVVVELDQRHDGGVREAAIGLVAERLQLVAGHRVADERRHDGDRGVDIGEAGERGDLVAGHRRPCLGEVEAAIGCETGERRRFEIEDGGRAAGADVTHGQAG